MNYQRVIYNTKTYYVCIYYDEGMEKLFVIDTDNFKNIIRPDEVYIINNDHIAREFITSKNMTKYYYVDKTIIKLLTQQEINNYGNNTHINYINGITPDLREENLRLIDENTANESRNMHRIKVIPDSTIRQSDIPKCVYYNSATHKFIIDIKYNGKRYYIPLTTSKNLSFEGKLEDAKMKLIQFSIDNPEIEAKKHLLENYSEKCIKLMKSFNDIIMLSDFDCIEESLVKIPKRKILKVNLNHLSDSDKTILANMPHINGTCRRCTTKLPETCAKNISDLPKYCQYRPALNGRSDYFYIKGHPNQDKELRSNGSTKMTTDEKYNQIINLLHGLNNPEIEI